MDQVALGQIQVPCSVLEGSDLPISIYCTFTSRKGLGKIRPAGQVWPAKGSHPACGRSLTTAQPRCGGQPQSRCVWPVPLPQGVQQRRGGTASGLHFPAVPTAEAPVCPGPQPCAVTPQPSWLPTACLTPGGHFLPTHGPIRSASQVCPARTGPSWFTWRPHLPAPSGAPGDGCAVDGQGWSSTPHSPPYPAMPGQVSILSSSPPPAYPQQFTQIPKVPLQLK